MTIARPWAVFYEILQERSFRLYALTLALIAFVFNLFPLAIPFYVKYTLGAGEGATSLIFGVSLVAALGSMPVWVKLFQRWGTAGVFLRAVGIVAIACVWLGLVPGLVSALLATALLGLGWAGCQVCFDLIRAGLVDQHFDLTGQRSEAFYYSLLGFSVHISGLLQGLAMFTIGIVFGYVSGAQPGPQPGNAFRFLISVLPAVSLLIVWQLARRFFLEIAPKPVHVSSV
jgi:GPH family glycoside/pentoside/hexuronide:cation symporter